MRTVNPGSTLSIWAGNRAKFVNSRVRPETLLNHMKDRGVRVIRHRPATTELPRTKAKFRKILKFLLCSPNSAIPTSWKDKPMLLKMNTSELITGRTAKDSIGIRLCPMKKVTRG